MKSLLLVLLLSGCSSMNLIWPVPHDPVEAGKLISVKQKMEEVSCVDKDPFVWQPLLSDLRWLNLYTEFREDPQAKAIEQMYVAVKKANEGSLAYCEATLKLNRTRILVIEKAMKGR